MKKITKFLVLCLTIVSSFFACFCFSACDKAKYTACKYLDIAYGDHERQTFNLYLPKEKSGTVGLILMIHGGSWVAGDKSGYDDDLDKWCTVYGYATASINYHYISSEVDCDDIMNDISLALAKIKETASVERGVNIEKVLLTGISAGGHLSLYYAYKYAETAPIKPVAVVDYSGPSDLTDENYASTQMLCDIDWYLDLFSLLSGAEITKDNYQSPEMQTKLLEVSPVNYVTQNTVPTLICHAYEDDIVPYSNATILSNRLQECGVKHDLISYENSGHSLGHDKKHQKEAKKLFVEYAERYLG